LPKNSGESLASFDFLVEKIIFEHILVYLKPRGLICLKFFVKYVCKMFEWKKIELKKFDGKVVKNGSVSTSNAL
jgi:hypothetical protein